MRNKHFTDYEETCNRNMFPWRKIWEYNVLSLLPHPIETQVARSPCLNNSKFGQYVDGWKLVENMRNEENLRNIELKLYFQLEK